MRALVRGAAPASRESLPALMDRAASSVPLGCPHCDALFSPGKTITVGDRPAAAAETTAACRSNSRPDSRKVYPARSRESNPAVLVPGTSTLELL